MSIQERIEKDPRVDKVWDEGEDGLWILLNKGFHDPESDCHACHERTWTALWRALKRCKICTCADCRKAIEFCRVDFTLSK